MSRVRLSDETIAARLVELRNLRLLHARDRKQIAQLKSDNKQLKAENQELRQLLDRALAQNKTQAIQITELQTMVFGKKKRPPTGTLVPALPALPIPPRKASTYRRLIPPTAAITREELVPLPNHCVCGGRFKQVTTHARYVEDIPLPDLTPDYQPQLVTKYAVAQGVCDRCGRKDSGMPLSGQAVTLGPNAHLLVSHLVTLVGMSYAQVANLLLTLYGLHVSDGEVANILQTQHKIWLPAYHHLSDAIRAAPVQHRDETPWHIQAEDNTGYVWVSSDDQSEDSLFSAATSRGAPHARKLHKQVNATSVYITDDYQAYRNLAGHQQLCWAHLYRVIRDLVHNQNLPASQADSVSLWHQQFVAIYEDVRLYLSEPYDEVVRETQSQELWQRVQALAREPAPMQGEPDKLRRLKAQLLRAGKDRLFVCLSKDTPCDNNRAERDLRQLVLKRKRSFGSKTLKGATVLMTVLSICTTTWRRNPTGYFKALAEIG